MENKKQFINDALDGKKNKKQVIIFLMDIIDVELTSKNIILPEFDTLYKLLSTEDFINKKTEKELHQEFIEFMRSLPEPTMNNHKPKYVYIMKNEHNLLKIGISKNPLNRCKLLSYTSGVGISLLAVYDVDKPALVIEQNLHKHFAQHRTYGEWFEPKFSIYDIESQLERICVYKNILFDRK